MIMVRKRRVRKDQLERTKSYNSDNASTKFTIRSCVTSSQPQKADGVEIWPEYWGITSTQLRDLLHCLRNDHTWSSENNVYTLVNDYIKPWTRGTGMGYALLINRGKPKEVNRMVSHAWSENAEDFIEALLRSTTKDDVLFICALSLYQAQDGAGPSISEQIGVEAADSPFYRALAHIRCKGDKTYFTWMLWPYLEVAPLLFAIAAQVSFSWPMVNPGCVPTFSRCIFPSTVEEPMHEKMLHDLQTHTFVHLSLPLCVVFTVCAVLSIVVLRQLRLRTYGGDMLVVPNREDDLYGRLWCVYEVFVAHTLGIPIRLAKTLASAGQSTSKTASCTSEADEKRIRCEIEKTYGKKHGYNRVDLSIAITSRGCALHALFSLVRLLLPVTFVSVGIFSFAKQAPNERKSHDFALCCGNSLGMAFVIACAFHVFSRAQGRPTWSEIVHFMSINVATACVTYFCFTMKPLALRLSLQCDRLLQICGIAALAVAVLICVSGWMILRFYWYTFRRGDARAVFGWLIVIVPLFLSLAVCHLSLWRTVDLKEFEFYHELATNWVFDPLQQFSFWVCYYSATWPVFLGIIVWCSRGLLWSCFLSLCVAIGATAVLSPIMVFKIPFASSFHYCYAVRCFLVLGLTLLMPAYVCARATRSWGLECSGTPLSSQQFMILAMMLVAGVCTALDSVWFDLFNDPQPSYV